jgi:hypothetical protein
MVRRRKRPELQWCAAGASTVCRQSFNGAPPELQMCTAGAASGEHRLHQHRVRVASPLWSVAAVMQACQRRRRRRCCKFDAIRCRRCCKVPTVGGAAALPAGVDALPTRSLAGLRSCFRGKVRPVGAHGVKNLFLFIFSVCKRGWSCGYVSSGGVGGSGGIILRRIITTAHVELVLFLDRVRGVT